ncbi:MAG: hypothetical protein Q9172_003257 [Xanthocarpia lactea]
MKGFSPLIDKNKLSSMDLGDKSKSFGAFHHAQSPEEMVIREKKFHTESGRLFSASEDFLEAIFVSQTGEESFRQVRSGLTLLQIQQQGAVSSILCV